MPRAYKLMKHQDDLVNDHMISALSTEQKLDYVSTIGNDCYNLVALQMIKPNSIAGRFNSWFTWFCGSIEYLPNLMDLEPDQMTERSNDYLIMGWLLTGEEKYVKKLVEGQQSPNIAAIKARDAFMSLSNWYPSFRDLLNSDATIHMQPSCSHDEDCNQHPIHNIQWDQDDNPE